MIRYRTGDLVRPTWPADRPIRFVLLDGGVLGRADDMLIIRGVNVFSSSIDQILRSFPEVPEYRVTAFKAAEMDQLAVEIEDHLNRPERVAEELQLRLGLKIEVRAVPLGSLPRFEGKGSRFSTSDDHHDRFIRRSPARSTRRRSHWRAHLADGRHGARLRAGERGAFCRCAMRKSLPSSAA